MQILPKSQWHWIAISSYSCLWVAIVLLTFVLVGCRPTNSTDVEKPLLKVSENKRDLVYQDGKPFFGWVEQHGE